MKTHTLYALLFTVFTLAGSGCLAQKDRPLPPPEPDGEYELSPEQRQQLEQYRIAYLTRELDLSVEDSQKFWPIYNESEKQVEAIRQRNKALMHKVQAESDARTDTELREQIATLLAAEAEELAARHRQIAAIGSVLKPRDVLRFMQAQRQFRLHLMEMLRERAGERNGEQNSPRQPNRRSGTEPGSRPRQGPPPPQHGQPEYLD